MKRVVILIAALVATAQAQKPLPQVEVPHLGNKTCPITGKAIDPKRYARIGDERVWVCCSQCIFKVKEDAKAAYAKAYPKDKVVDVKNEKCPIMGGKTKKDVSTTVQGYKVRFCCKGCDEKLRQDPDRYLALATRKGLKEMNNPNCPIMIDRKVRTGKFITYKDWLIGICCPGCDKGFSGDPDGFLAELLEERAKRQKKGR